MASFIDTQIPGKMIDCLICGVHQHCSQVLMSVSAVTSVQGDPVKMNTEALVKIVSEDHCNDGLSKKEKNWSGMLCKLLEINTNEMESIIESSFYCDACHSSLQQVREMYSQIEKLNEKLNCLKRLYKESLKTAAKLNQNQNSDSETQNDNQDFKRKHILQSLCKQRVPSVIKIEAPDPQDPSSTCDHDNENPSDFDNCTFDTDVNESKSTGPDVLSSPTNNRLPIFQVPDRDHDHDINRISTKNKKLKGSQEALKPRINRIRNRKSLSRKSSKATRSSNRPEMERKEVKGPSSQTVASRVTKNIYKKYYKSKSVPFRKRKPLILPLKYGDSSSEMSESDEDDCNNVGDPEFLIENHQLNTDSKELRKKYDGLIKKYDVKEVVISVDKLPDADFDAAAVGTTSVDNSGKRRCPILGCNMLFLKKHRLADHLKTVHRGIKYPYECSSCHKKFAQRRQFKDHENIHTQLTPHECPYPDCGKKFSTLGRLFGHKGHHHKEPRFQCEQCGKCFIIKSSYDYHIRSHLGERPFICEICGRTFIKEVDLKNHQRFHPELNLELLKCKFCGKIFTSPNSLKVHEKFHSGDLPFQCDLCDYRAPTNYVLNKHKLIHKVGQEYECNICHGKFKHGNSLAKHKKYVCGTAKDCKDFVCKFCGKGYKSKIHLSKHEKLHTDTSKPFLCSTCGKDFRFRDKLKRHIFQVHTDKTEKPGKIKSKVGIGPSTAVTTAATHSANSNCETENGIEIPMVYQSEPSHMEESIINLVQEPSEQPPTLLFHPHELVDSFLP